MTALQTYSTGTVSVSEGGTTVTGIGAIWSGTNALPGDVLQIDEFQTIISDVTDVTHLEIPPWGGGDQTEVAYTIWKVSPQRFSNYELGLQISDVFDALITDGFFRFVKSTQSEPDPSYGKDGQYSRQPTTGKEWFKEGGVWNYQGIFKPFGKPEPYDSEKTYSFNDVATSGGSSYVWINEMPGNDHAPPNETYWQILAEKGAPGDPGGPGTPGDNGADAPTYGGTSTTSLTIGTGSKVFTTQAGLAYLDGARVRASSDADPADWMEGVITYIGTTLTMDADMTNGSGTLDDWNFNIAGQPGEDGAGDGDMKAANALSELTGAAATARSNIGAFGTGDALGSAQVAAQSDQESASSTTLAVTPGRQKFHPSAAKAWAKVTQSGTMTLNASFGMSSVTDLGAGDSQFNLATVFSSTHYAVAGLGQQNTGNNEIWAGAYTTAAGSFRVVSNNGGSFVDTVGGVIAFGDQ